VAPADISCAHISRIEHPDYQEICILEGGYEGSIRGNRHLKKECHGGLLVVESMQMVFSIAIELPYNA